MKYKDIALNEVAVASSWIEDLTFIEDTDEDGDVVVDVDDDGSVIVSTEDEDDSDEDDGYEVITLDDDEEFDEDEFGWAFDDDDDEGISLDFAFDDEDTEDGGVMMTVKNGKTYFIPMPYEMYLKWLEASSKGKFWWSDVKGIYT